MDENIFYPELTLETDDIIMELTIKKDYSKIRDSDKRKEEFIKRWKELEVICEDIFDAPSGSPMDELFTRYMYYERAKQGIKLTTTEAL